MNSHSDEPAVTVLSMALLAHVSCGPRETMTSTKRKTTIPDSMLARLRRLRIFFGHQSVGGNCHDRNAVDGAEPACPYRCRSCAQRNLIPYRRPDRARMDRGEWPADRQDDAFLRVLRGPGSPVGQRGNDEALLSRISSRMSIRRRSSARTSLRSTHWRRRARSSSWCTSRRRSLPMKDWAAKTTAHGARADDERAAEREDPRPTISCCGPEVRR